MLEDVAESGAHGATPVGKLCDAVQLVFAHEPETHEHREIGCGVEREAPTIADADDQSAGQRGAEDPRRVDDGAVEHDRVREITRRDHLTDEGAAQWIVEREKDSAREGQRVERADGGMRRERQGGEPNRLGHLQRLRQHEQPAFVEPVGDGTGPRRQDENRTILTGREDPDAKTAPGDLQDQQRERDVREPVAGVRDRLADEVELEVAVAERRERATDETGVRSACGTFGVDVGAREDPPSGVDRVGRRQSFEQIDEAW